MSIALDDRRLEALARKIDPGAKLVRAWELTGGVSAQVLALEVEGGGTTSKLVARLHGDADLRSNPHIARDELALLRLVGAAGLPVPASYLVDETLFDRPCIVVAFVDGVTEFAPADLPDYLQQMAAALARIHSIDGDTPELAFLPRLDTLAAEKLRARPAALDESIGEGRIRHALEAAYPFPRANAPALLHGDYWAGNILWKDGSLAAVIDWEDARVGDPLADLGSSRLETLWALGVEAMHDYTRRYLSLRSLDTTSLPYWDLYAALRPAHQLSLWAEGSAERERHFREGHAAFVAQAVAALAKPHL